MSRAVKQRKRTALRPDLAVGVMAALAVVLLVCLVAGRSGGEAGNVQDPIQVVESSQALFTVCIDPGHGGEDQGASWEGRLEKDDNLSVALALQKALSALNVRAVLTREGDDTLKLEERVAFAEAQEADYFISLHRNFAEESACGLEVWVAEQCSDAAADLAQRVSDGLTAVGVQRSRGVRRGTQSGQGDYYVLAHTTMPAVLVELGFLQDSEDNRLLDEHLEEYAAAIADALMAAWTAD